MKLMSPTSKNCHQYQVTNITLAREKPYSQPKPNSGNKTFIIYLQFGQKFFVVQQNFLLISPYSGLYNLMKMKN